MRLGYKKEEEPKKSAPEASMRPRRMRLGYYLNPGCSRSVNYGASMRPRRMRLGYKSHIAW